LGAFAGLGAAVENLVLAAHHHGIEVVVELFPDPDKPTWAAKIGLREGPTEHSQPHTLDDLYDYIPKRCTNRRIGSALTVDQANLAQLEAAVRTVPGAHIRIHTIRSVIDDLASIYGRAGALQMFEPAFHRELISELRWTDQEAQEKRDGIDIATLELGWSDLIGLRICKSSRFVRLLAQCGAEAMVTRLFAKPVRTSAAVALIWMDGHQPIDYLQGGRAMQRTWLTATELNLSFYPVSTLPYFFARLLRGDGKSMSTSMQEGVRHLRGPYTKHFEVGDHQGEIISFCLSDASAPSAHSLRKPLQSVVRTED
jgi:hypothetical protein